MQVQAPHSLKRYLKKIHFDQIKATGIRCTLDTCTDKLVFPNIRAFLHHITADHYYDPKISVGYLDGCTPARRAPRTKRHPRTNRDAYADRMITLTSSDLSDSATDSGGMTDESTDATTSCVQTPVPSACPDFEVIEPPVQDGYMDWAIPMECAKTPQLFLHSSLPTTRLVPVCREWRYRDGHHGATPHLRSLPPAAHLVTVCRKLGWRHRHGAAQHLSFRLLSLILPPVKHQYY